MTIANNCLTTNYNNNYTILLGCDYVILESIIMYTFSKAVQFLGLLQIYVFEVKSCLGVA